jgi:hypothetical protein
MVYFIEIEENPKTHLETQKSNQSNSEQKKNSAGGITVTLQSHKQHGTAQKQTHRPIEQSRGLRSQPSSHLILHKGGKNMLEKRQSYQ